MKLLLAAAYLAALTAPVLAAGKTETFVINKGSYACKTCVPAFTVKADGGAYPVKGANFDAVAVRLTGNGTTEIRMKGGKVVTTINTSVSSDRRTATTDFTDTSGPKPFRAGWKVAPRATIPFPAPGCRWTDRATSFLAESKKPRTDVRGFLVFRLVAT
jgi:hypothetical protein